MNSYMYTDHLSRIDHWKRWVNDKGIFKNLSTEEAVYIKATKDWLGSQQDWDCLVIAGDVLLDNNKIEQHLRRTKKRLTVEVARPNRRNIFFVRLCNDWTRLNEPETFKSFQRLLFEARVYFETSFESGNWAPDERGLYARSPRLQGELSLLSRLHNLVVDALKEFKAGQNRTGGVLMRTAFLHLELIVQRNNHHRQVQDILAVLILLKRGGHDRIQQLMLQYLVGIARRDLPDNHPRRIMFTSLTNLPMFQSSNEERTNRDRADEGHLLFAFDTYCRHLWMSRVGNDPDEARQLIAHYCFNLAFSDGPGTVQPGDVQPMAHCNQLAPRPGEIQRHGSCP